MDDKRDTVNSPVVWPDGTFNEGDTCPRRGEGHVGRDITGQVITGQDAWRRHHMDPTLRSCTYCGSLHPDDFMRLIRMEEYSFGLTDKNYKAYVMPAYFKFYYRHLSEAQSKQLIDWWNDKTLPWPEGGSLPYFVVIDH